jgi:hypothetical protein
MPYKPKLAGFFLAAFPAWVNNLLILLIARLLMGRQLMADYVDYESVGR